MAQPDRSRVRPQCRWRLRRPTTRNSGRSAAASRPPRRLSRPISSPPTIPAATAHGRGRTTPFTNWPTRLKALQDAPLHADAQRHQPRLFRGARQAGGRQRARPGDARAGSPIPNDGAAADEIEANPLEVGLTRTRCVATMLEGGHADNALPQMAKATVNCRIMPGVQPKDVQAELQQLAGAKVEVDPRPQLHRRADAALAAAARRAQGRHQRDSARSTVRRCTSIR